MELESMNESVEMIDTGWKIFYCPQCLRQVIFKPDPSAPHAPALCLHKVIF